MPKTTTERMTAYRMRQRIAGLATLSLIVPEEDAAMFQAFAAERRKQKIPAAGKGPMLKHWFSVLEGATPAKPSNTSRSVRKLEARAVSRAELLAEKIIMQIISMGWPVGRPLGSEAELMQQHGVSRTVLRQAVRLLEHHAVARMLRGTGGGLVVDAPDPAATARAVSIYLEYQRIGPRDILETRKILEQATVSLAVARLTEAGERKLGELIEAESSLDGNANARSLQRFHFSIAKLSGDPALRLFAGIVLQLSDAHSNFSRRPREDRDRVVRRIRKLHRDIAAAMVARDADSACRLMERYLDGYRGWME